MTEQPRPKTNGQRFIQHMVIDDMHDRLKHGIRTYGTGLQVGNGRSAEQDAYEEALDLAVYLRQVVETRRVALRNISHLRGVIRSCQQDGSSVAEIAEHVLTDLNTIAELLGERTNQELDSEN